jgi:hypothetical protein
VPQLIFESDQGTQAWNNFVDASVSVWQDFSITSVNIVSNSADLGEVGAPSTEPDPGDVTIQTFASPAVLPALVAGTTPVTALTTLPSQVYAFLALAGSAIQSYLPSLSGLVGFRSTISANSERVADALESLANSLESIATDLSAIRPAILPPDPEAPPEGSLVDQLRTMRDQLQAVAETRNTLRLKTHGVEVQAESGAIID